MDERIKHELQLTYFPSGTGFVASCKCGERFRRARGCKPAGLVYAEDGAQKDFADHLAANPEIVEEVVVLHRDSNGKVFLYPEANAEYDAEKK